MNNFFLSIVILGSCIAQAQVGIGTTTPDAAAALDITSTTQGFLPPRMTATQRDAIATPVQGLIIYCTNCGTEGQLQAYNGTGWLSGGTEFVNLTTNQTINGTKTFLADVLINGLTVGKGGSNQLGNTAIGVDALSINVSGVYNTAIGAQALYTNTYGESNTANGVQALHLNTTGNSNTANGLQALYTNEVGSNNTATGRQALFSNTAGESNTANGMDALKANTNGSFNTATGRSALEANTYGSDNTAIGVSALYTNTNGSHNNANGARALYTNITGSYNTATGESALFFNTGGDDNTATGTQALFTNTTGSKNTATGQSALHSNTTGSSNTALGYNANVGSGILSNATAIGAKAVVTASNTIQLGADGTNGTTAITNVKTSGTLTAGTVTYPNTHNANAGQVLTTDAAGVATWSTPTSSAGLMSITEGSNTGYRRADAVAANYGTIGSNAVDLSFSNVPSTTFGATGDFSTAMGYGTTASGFASTAMGSGTEASGDYSTAMGVELAASGDYSIAMGFGTTASGDYSTALGFGTTARDFGSVVMGQYNDAGSLVTGATSFSASAPAFVIGNGTVAEKSDAFMVDFSGNVTVGGNVYLAGRESTDTGKILVLGASGLIVPTSIPIASETDTGLVSTGNQFFGGDKNFNGTITANSFIGNGSLLTDLPSSAGLISITEGSNTGYRRADAVAANYGTIGSGAVDLSFSFPVTGSLTNNYGATGHFSTAMGRFTVASGLFSTAMGEGTTASGSYSTGMGIGTTASGTVSTAMGQSTTASDYGSLVMGQYNSAGSTITNANSFDPTAPAFVIGNGTNPSAKSDAFVVDFSGKVTAAGTLTAGTVTYPNTHNANAGQVLTTDAAGVATWTTPISSAGLMSITEDSNTGYRRADAPAGNYGAIGSGAVDLSFSALNSTTNGATGENSTAMGSRTTASGPRSTAMGDLTTAQGDFSTAMGQLTTAQGDFATAMGNGTTASDFGSVVMGQFNSAGSTPTSANSFDTTAPAFVIGNGTNPSAKSDAFVVDFSGNVTAAGTLTAGTVTYPNTHNANAGQVLTTDAAGVATWTTPTTNIAAGSIRNVAISDQAEIAQSKISGLTDALDLKAPLANPVFTGDVIATRYVLTVAAATVIGGITTLDLSTGNVLTVDLNANITSIALSNPAVGTYLMKFIQDSTGNRTVDFPNTWKWSGGTAPTLTATANKTDIVTLIYDGSNYYAAISQNF